MSHCLTRPVELVWQRHVLFCVVDYCLGTAFVTLQVCLGDENGALCRRCCDVFYLDIDAGMVHAKVSNLLLAFFKDYILI